MFDDFVSTMLIVLAVLFMLLSLIVNDPPDEHGRSWNGMFFKIAMVLLVVGIGYGLLLEGPKT